MQTFLVFFYRSVLYLCDFISLLSNVIPRQFCRDSICQSKIYVGNISKILILLDQFCLVVGGGSAGSVLARRLTDDMGIRVLVLEAGMDDHKIDLINIPLAAHQLTSSHIDWGTMTVPQRHSCRSFTNQVLYHFFIIIQN